MTTRDSAARRRHVRWAYRRMTLRHLRRWWRERCVRCGRRPFWSESRVFYDLDNLRKREAQDA